jgi:hypothetical protein
MTTWGIFKTDVVSESYKKMKAEELKGNQHKLDKNKNGKIDSSDLKAIRNEEAEEVEEGWDDMMKSVKDKHGTQPNGGSGKKQGTRYGGGKQKDDEAQERKSKKNESVQLEQIDDVMIAEAINADDYHATSEKSQFGGHRAIVKHKAKGTVMYAGGTRYSTAEKAKEGAHTYLNAYEKHGPNRAMSAVLDHGKSHGVKESMIADDSAVLDEEKQADIVKMGAKEIKHANMKDKQDDAEIMEPHSEGEANFIDKHYVNVTDDTADKQDCGTCKLTKATEPKGQGAGKYDGKGKTGVKEDTSEDDSVKEACGKKGSGKKSFSSFKAKVTG